MKRAFDCMGQAARQAVCGVSSIPGFGKARRPRCFDPQQQQMCVPAGSNLLPLLKKQVGEHRGTHRVNLELLDSCQLLWGIDRCAGLIISRMGLLLDSSKDFCCCHGAVSSPASCCLLQHGLFLLSFYALQAPRVLLAAGFKESDVGRLQQQKPASCISECMHAILSKL